MIDPALLLSLIVNAIIGFWAFYKSSLWPARQKEREVEQVTRIERDRDVREYQQRTQSDAFTQILGINEQLIGDLITDRREEREHYHELEGLFVKFMGDVSDRLNRMIAVQERQKGAQETMLRDWSRLNEVVSDIDQMYHRIEATLMAIATGRQANMLSKQLELYQQYLDEDKLE